MQLGLAHKAQGGTQMHIATLASAGLRPRRNASNILATTMVGISLLIGPAARSQDDSQVSAKDIPPILKIGAHAPDFHLLGIDGKYHSLQDYASSKVLVIIF